MRKVRNKFFVESLAARFAISLLRSFLSHRATNSGNQHLDNTWTIFASEAQNHLKIQLEIHYMLKNGQECLN